MKKYWLVFKNSIQKAIIYRFNTFVGLLIHIISFGLIFYLWNSVYLSGGQVGSYSLRGIIIYYLLVIALNIVMRGNVVAWTTGDDIQQGTVTNYLLKPINFFWYKIFDALGALLYRVVIYAIAVLFILLFIHKYLSFSLSLETLFYFIAFVILGLIINLIFFYIIGITGFWLGTVQGFIFAIMTIVNFLSGTIIPLDLLPNFLIVMSDFLPFKYMMFFPIAIFNGTVELHPSLFFSPIIWIIILYTISILVFKQGIKKYEGYGA